MGASTSISRPFRRSEDGEFLLTIAVARDARFGIVGAAAREGFIGRGESDGADTAEVVTYAEACERRLTLESEKPPVPRHSAQRLSSTVSRLPFTTSSGCGIRSARSHFTEAGTIRAGSVP